MAGWRWGNVPVPEAHLAGLAAGIVAQLIVSWILFPVVWIGQALGWPLVVLGFTVAVWAVSAAADTDLKEPGRVVDGGPYRLSRNPMYVAWTCAYVGIAFIVNTGWPLLALPFVLLWTHIEVRREERGLEARFGDEYRGYRRRVRRYL